LASRSEERSVIRDSLSKHEKKDKAERKTDPLLQILLGERGREDFSLSEEVRLCIVIKKMNQTEGEKRKEG